MIFAFSLIISIFFTSFQVALYADFNVYKTEYEKYDVLSELDMTMDDAMYVTHEMMDYLIGERHTLSVITTVEGTEQDFFSMNRTDFIWLRSKDFFREVWPYVSGQQSLQRHVWYCFT